MPKLNDARRLCRLAMVIDELHSADISSNVFTISKAEFVMCGGTAKAKDKMYSLYRQLVYATRDYRAFILRGKFVSADTITKAKKLFYFRENTRVNYNEANDEDMKTKDFNRVLRILILLQKFRKVLKAQSTYADVRRVADSSVFSYDEFLLAGGKKTKNYEADKTGTLRMHLSYAINDMKMFFDRGRMPPPCVINKAWNHICDDKDNCLGSQQLLSSSPSTVTQYIDDSDEEDVDIMDTLECDISSQHNDSDIASADESEGEFVD